MVQGRPISYRMQENLGLQMPEVSSFSIGDWVESRPFAARGYSRSRFGATCRLAMERVAMGIGRALNARERSVIRIRSAFKRLPYDLMGNWAAEACGRWRRPTRRRACAMPSL